MSIIDVVGHNHAVFLTCQGSTSFTIFHEIDQSQKKVCNSIKASESELHEMACH